MGGISFTAHVSNKKSGITSKAKLEGVAKHNLRKYRSEEYSADNIKILCGTENLVEDVKKIYHQEFDNVLKAYNEKQTRADRKIDNYFNHVANKEQDMAVELIIQVGDRDFWKENEDKIRRAAILYSVLLHELREQIPQFVIANAVIHLDEDSPHMHVVGVPVASGYKKGLSKQVSKRKVFTKEILSDVLQGSFREFASNKSKIVFGEEFREKSKGRNHDLTVAEYKVSQENQRYEQLREKAEEKELKIDLLQKENINLEEQHDFLANRVISSQLACNEVNWKIEKAKKEKERLEECVRMQNIRLLDLEEKSGELIRKAEIAETVIDMMKSAPGESDIRDRLIDVMYENEKLREENSKLKELLNKAYDFMKQFVVDGRNLLERFLESVGQAVEKVRSGLSK